MSLLVAFSDLWRVIRICQNSFPWQILMTPPKETLMKKFLDFIKTITACMLVAALLINSLTWFSGRADWIIPVMLAEASASPAPEVIEESPSFDQVMYLADLTRTDQLHTTTMRAMLDRIEALEQRIAELEMPDVCGLQSVECDSNCACANCVRAH